MDQIDPYKVPELFRGVPRPKNNQKKNKKCIKITLPKLKKRNFLKSARTKTETGGGATAVGRRLSAVGRWPIGRPPQSFSFGTRRFQKIRFFQFRKCYFNAFFCGFLVIFRPRDPSKKLRHVVRINLVQFSAPGLQ